MLTGWCSNLLLAVEEEPVTDRITEPELHAVADPGGDPGVQRNPLFSGVGSSSRKSRRQLWLAKLGVLESV